VNPNTSERRFAGWSYIISSSETESSTSRSASNSAMSRVRSFRIDASEFAISIGSMATTASRSASACSRNDHPFSSAVERIDSRVCSRVMYTPFRSDSSASLRN